MKALGMSFVYAIRGIFYCLHHERNMRIHFVCMAYMYFFLLGFDFFSSPARSLPSSFWQMRPLSWAN
ncbi:MAG: diacylglycerol kinase [Acutalibacteraceae bacterium]